MIRIQPTSTLFPYTTLFRSQRENDGEDAADDQDRSQRTVVHEVQVDRDYVEGENQAGQEQDDSKSEDRKSTRLNSSHSSISYAVFCLKKKNEKSACLPGQSV